MVKQINSIASGVAGSKQARSCRRKLGRQTQQEPYLGGGGGGAGF